MPRYGKMNSEYLATWFARDEPGGPMWALNLMKYRAHAEYADGRSSSLTGAEADDVYAPHEHLRAVGSRIILIAPVVHHLVGDDRLWDRVAIAQYRDRLAMAEMSSSEAFASAEEHKDAGMEFTIVMATFPVEGDEPPAQVSAADTDRLLLVQVVADASRHDVAAEVDAIRIGRFAVEDWILGDGRAFAEARFDLISPEVAADLASRPAVRDDSAYVMIADPSLDDVARSLSDPSRVLL